MLKKLNNENFADEILNGKGIALVDFYADWCGPCQMVAPIVAEIANERADITVGKINVDEAGEIAMKYDVMSIPTLIVFKDGKEQSRIVGYRPKNAILAELP
ncbi:MAG: thioredoxin [Clostridia bacterium]|nr:thioredoxin [Clostridia bacterium]